MLRALLFVTVATATVVMLVRQSPRPRSTMNRTRRLGPRVVPANAAAERLREAWADYHTVA